MNIGSLNGHAMRTELRVSIGRPVSMEKATNSARILANVIAATDPNSTTADLKAAAGCDPEAKRRLSTMIAP
jgi:hypothetical protein